MSRSLKFNSVLAALGIAFCSRHAPALAQSAEEGDPFADDSAQVESGDKVPKPSPEPAPGETPAQHVLNNAVISNEDPFADPDATFGEPDEAELDARLRTLDTYLADVQKPTRWHSYGWLSAQVALIGVSGFLAATTEGPQRTGAIVRGSLSGGNFLLQVIIPQPGRNGLRKFRKMPQGTLEEKRAKADAGQSFISGQAKADELATSWPTHVLASLIALGAGATVFALHEDGLREAITTTIGVLLVAELQIQTRSARARIDNKAYAESPTEPRLSVAPFISQHAQGLAMSTQF